MVGPNEFWICEERAHGTELKKENYTIKGELKDAKLPSLFLAQSVNIEINCENFLTA